MPLLPSRAPARTAVLALASVLLLLLVAVLLLLGGNRTGYASTAPQSGRPQDASGNRFSVSSVRHAAQEVPQGGTATPTPQCNTQTFTGSIVVNDPIRDGSLNIDDNPSTCATPKTCPGVYEGLYNYDAYTFVNTTGATACIDVFLDGQTCGLSDRRIWSTAYLGSFNPNSACENYLADSGYFSSNLVGPVD